MQQSGAYAPEWSDESRMAPRAIDDNLRRAFAAPADDPLPERLAALLDRLGTGDPPR